MGTASVSDRCVLNGACTGLGLPWVPENTGTGNRARKAMETDFGYLSMPLRKIRLPDLFPTTISCLVSDGVLNQSCLFRNIF